MRDFPWTLIHAQAALNRRLERGSPRPIAVAFSGGPDSYVALRCAKAWADYEQRPLIALHVDHGLNPRSRAWGEAAGAVAAALNVPFRRLAWEGEKPARGVPAAARAARHRLLANAARQAGARVIITGHTGDDALENQVMGLGPLAEWSPSPVWPEGREVFLLRPLLHERRAALRERLSKDGVLTALVDDPANADPAHRRIAARGAIGGQGNAPGPAPDDAPAAALASLAQICGPAIRLARAAFTAAPDQARRRVVAAAAVCAGGGERLPRRERLARLSAALTGAESVAATLCGAKVAACADEIVFTRDAGEIARGRVAPLRLAPGAQGVFDGRFLLSAGVRPMSVRPLKGFASALPAFQKQGLKALCAAARPTLPMILEDAGPTCPFLAGDGEQASRVLIGARFLAACGAIAHEGGL